MKYTKNGGAKLKNTLILKNRSAKAEKENCHFYLNDETVKTMETKRYNLFENETYDRSNHTL